MKLKLPSIRELGTKTAAIFFRFQLISLLLIIGFSLSLYLSFGKTALEEIQDRALQFLVSLSLTITLLFPARLAIENGSLRGILAKWIEPIAMIPGIVLYWSLPLGDNDFTLLHGTRICMLMIAAGLTVFLFAKDSLKSDDLLWNWHGSLVPAIARGVLYCFILQMGIGAAFGAIDYLFGTKLIQNTYLRINLLLLWIVGPFITLHSINHGEKSSQLVELKSIIMQIPQFLLFPLTVIYLVILYAYGIQILVKMDLPKGMVSQMVLGFAGFGLFTFWVMVPFLREEKFRWIEKARKGFFILQIPLVILLAFGISRRISDYGWTFQRYLIVELAIWLAIVAVATIIFKRTNFRMIIGSLIFVSLITVLGPVNAYTVTVSNQKERLTSILDRGGMMADGKLCKASGTLNDSLIAEVGSIMRYLDEYGLTKQLNGMNPDTGDLSLSKVESITGIDFPYNRYGNPAKPSTYFNYYSSQTSYNECDSLPDGTRILTVNFSGNQKDQEVELKDSFLKKYRCSRDGFVILIDSAHNSLYIPLQKYARELKRQPESQRNFGWIEQNEFLSAQVLVNSVSGNLYPGDSVNVDYSQVILLVKSVK